MHWNEWFEALTRWQNAHADLLAQYPGQFVAVVDGRLAGVDPDLEPLLGMLRATGSRAEATYLWFVTREGHAVPVLHSAEPEPPPP